MNALFYTAAIVAIFSTVMVITQLNAVHALLYLIVSLLSVALIFFLLGAPFAAALEVIIYAGAIMVLFLFVVMMLNLGAHSIDVQRRWLSPSMWVGPAILCGVLLIELIYVLGLSGVELTGNTVVGPRAVGQALFGPYVLAVELASVMLLAGLVGAYHLARPEKQAPAQGEV